MFDTCSAKYYVDLTIRPGSKFQSAQNPGPWRLRALGCPVLTRIKQNNYCEKINLKIKYLSVIID